MSLSKNIEIIILSGIIVLGILVRLYRFNGPIADWHSWRQSDTSAVSRNFISSGFDLLHPKYDDISNVQSGLDNPQGYRFVEFPIYNLAQAGLFKIFGILTIEEWGRIVTITASMISVLFIYLLTSMYASPRAGLFAAAFFAFIPFNIYYDRTILPDPSMVMAILGGLYFFTLWLNQKSTKYSPYIYYILSVIFTSASFLLKPYALFFTIPLFWIAWQRFGKRILIQPLLWLFLVVTLLPLSLWRLWILHYPEGIPASSWLLNGGNIRFTGAFFYWIFSQRIGWLILGIWGLPVIVLGIIGTNNKLKKAFFITSVISSLTYIAVIARGNVQHDYYQILIIPTLAFLYGLGADFLLAKDKFPRITQYLTFFICTIFMLAFGWYQVRDYFNINNPSILIAGRAVDSMTPKNAKIVAPYNGDTTLLYQMNRKGWPSFEKSLPELINMGAGYLVLVNPKPQDYDIGKTYKILSANDNYILFDLTHKK